MIGHALANLMIKDQKGHANAATAKTGSAKEKQLLNIDFLPAGDILCSTKDDLPLARAILSS